LRARLLWSLLPSAIVATVAVASITGLMVLSSRPRVLDVWELWLLWMTVLVVFVPLFVVLDVLSQPWNLTYMTPESTGQSAGAVALSPAKLSWLKHTRRLRTSVLDRDEPDMVRLIWEYLDRVRALPPECRDELGRAEIIKELAELEHVMRRDAGLEGHAAHHALHKNLAHALYAIEYKLLTPARPADPYR